MFVPTELDRPVLKIDHEGPPKYAIEFLVIRSIKNILLKGPPGMGSKAFSNVFDRFFGGGKKTAFLRRLGAPELRFLQKSLWFAVFF